MTLYHFTCDHHADEVRRDGHVRSLMDLLGDDAPAAARLPQAEFAWFTDLDVPHRKALGLTSHITRCDRTAHRFEVTDATAVTRYLDVRRYHPRLWSLELAPGAMPAHWWIASEPVPVRPS